MKPDSQAQQPTSQDRALMRNTLLKLTAAQKLLCAAVIIITALVWYDLLKRLVAFGKGIDYGGLHALGGQAIALMNEYNAFFWWAVVALCTLIIAYFLYGFVLSVQRRSRARVVGEETIATLAARLTEPAREVLRWAWNDHREPVTVGDLQRAYTELRHGRHGRITLARRHEALLSSSASTASSNNVVG